VQARSSGEMREKLGRRAERPEDVEPVVARLKDAGYLDDRRFAEAFASARLANDKMGRTRVIQELRRRRVAPALAAETVRAVYADVDEETLIEAWIRRKYRQAPTIACSRSASHRARSSARSNALPEARTCWTVSSRPSRRRKTSRWLTDESVCPTSPPEDE